MSSILSDHSYIEHDGCRTVLSMFCIESCILYIFIMRRDILASCMTTSSHGQKDRLGPRRLLYRSERSTSIEHASFFLTVTASYCSLWMADDDSVGAVWWCVGVSLFPNGCG